jgi:hypothetical protein
MMGVMHSLSNFGLCISCEIVGRNADRINGIRGEANVTQHLQCRLAVKARQSADSSIDITLPACSSSSPHSGRGKPRQNYLVAFRISSTL